MWSCKTHLIPLRIRFDASLPSSCHQCWRESLHLPLPQQLMSSPTCESHRWYMYPGWKTMVSTRDARTREQREADRKARQIEKLPKPEALHDYQYPFEKTILSDYMCQYPVYENELDTPYLFNITPPPMFCVYWNVHDFERTRYPPVPKDDHRLLIPSNKSLEWKVHRVRMTKYLRKHEIVPHYLPHALCDVNLSVVFNGNYRTRAGLNEIRESPKEENVIESEKRIGNDHTHNDIDNRVVSDASKFTARHDNQNAVNELNKRNFWFTSHCGNYIHLSELQEPPSIFFVEKFNEEDQESVLEKNNNNNVLRNAQHEKINEQQGNQENTSSVAETYYTLLIVSPDYPYRRPLYADREEPDRGFFLNYMIANLPGKSVLSNYYCNTTTSNDGKGNIDKRAVVHSSSSEKKSSSFLSTEENSKWENEEESTSNDQLESSNIPCRIINSTRFAKHGDVVIPYVPPLPTEDAGTSRFLCILYKQTSKVHISPLSPEAEQMHFDLSARSSYRLHGTLQDGVHVHPCLASLRAVERSLSEIPSAITFFHTTWDIYVQEFYEKIKLPEPALPVDDEVEALLEFHSKRPEELRIRSHYRPDGSVNNGEDNTNFWMQGQQTLIQDGSMQRLWSRRTSFDKNGVPIVYPGTPR